MPRCLYGLLLVLVMTPLVSRVASICPPGCCCPHPRSLVLCESLGLQNLPRAIPLSTSVLSMANNRLCNVDHLLRVFADLRELSLGHNRLPRFPRGLPPSLQSLQLRENHITYLTAGGLRQLGNLTRLDLEDNRIRFIQPGALLRLTKLRVLSLKGNRLLDLPRSLPSSLAHLDLSANCVSSLDLTSLAPLVNLQVLKVNSNCLKSVPVGAFDGLPRLQTIALADNLWVCECNIFYLYRWLLDGRLRMATDLVCAAPVHLARRLLLTLSITTICPWVLKPNDTRVPPDTRVPYKPLDSQAALPGTDSMSVSTTTRPFLASFRQPAKASQTPAMTDDHTWHIRQGLLAAHLPVESYVLEELSYKDCLSLNSTPQPVLQVDSSVAHKDTTCTENTVGHYTDADSTTTGPASPALPTDKAGPQPITPIWPVRLQESNAILAMLVTLCVLVILVLLLLLLLLRKVLRRNQRVAPIQNS
uniref:Slit homolog 2 protein-like n=1 Tax=Paramormyrops kingsleyae TaxID=1676925 RepID=A0A3B3QX55_9TELE|nr:slit homolog 2 protein-like [Paramormyrops kingsleyae]